MAKAFLGRDDFDPSKPVEYGSNTAWSSYTAEPRGDGGPVSFFVLISSFFSVKLECRPERCSGSGEVQEYEPTFFPATKSRKGVRVKESTVVICFHGTWLNEGHACMI